MGWQALDAFFALGLGVLTALCYAAFRGILWGKGWPLALADGGAIVLAVFLLCSYSAGRGYAGVPRWYTALALGLGFWAAGKVLFAPANRLFAAARRTLARPLLWAKAGIVRRWSAVSVKMRAFSAKTAKSVLVICKKTFRRPLHKKKKVLYTS